MVKSTTVADDLTQDILVRAWEKRGSFDNRSSISTWLFAITFNLCIDHLRKNKRLKFDDWSAELDIPDVYDESEIEEVFELRQEKLTLLLEMLRPEDKAIILLKYMEEYDLHSIGAILGIKGESAVKMRLSRARLRLLALYNKFLPIFD